MRCPGNTIQFLNYGYSQYIKKVLELVEINPDKIEWKLYEDWTEKMLAQVYVWEKEQSQSSQSFAYEERSRAEARLSEPQFSARKSPSFVWSGREDLNLRPPEPHSGALPNCATPRLYTLY